ncbi:MAG: hypothetical protein DMF89_05625 [Acidobacteria bacterium]|nr:MAG: hypothetical protein DMF89_05625 [Acidobacteriota bacterium]
MAFLHDPGPRGAGARDVEDLSGRRVHYAGLTDLLRSGRLETWWRSRLDDRILRPRSQPHVLGRREPGTGLEQRPAPRRQPVSRLGRGARPRHRPFEVAFPVHAQRHLRLRLRLNWNGTPVKLLLWGNRNGYFYALDRETGRFLLGKPFVKVNWSSGLDERGRPIPTPQPPGSPTFPGNQGGTNWYPPSYSPRTGLFYLSAWENYASIYQKVPQEYKEGRYFIGGLPTTLTPVPNAPGAPTLARGPINTWTEAVSKGAVLAIDPKTGDRKWRYEMTDVTDSGILVTASDLLFTGGREGYFHALDARTGACANRHWTDDLPGRRQAVRGNDLGHQPRGLRP